MYLSRLLTESNKLSTNQKRGCQLTGIRNGQKRKMLWGIKALKSSEIFLGTERSCRSSPGLGVCSRSLGGGPKHSPLTDLQAPGKQEAKVKAGL